MLLIVAVTFPVLVSVTCCDALVPVVTEPKLAVVGEAVSVAEAGAAPVPDAEIVVGEFVALLAMEIVAESVTLLCGANVTFKIALPLAYTTPSDLSPVTE